MRRKNRAQCVCEQAPRPEDERDVVSVLAAEGSLRSHLDRLVDFEGFGQIVGLPAVFDIEQRYR
jgi:hypothetical protein